MRALTSSVLVAIALAVVTTGCGDDQSSAGSDPESTTAPTEPPASNDASLKASPSSEPSEPSEPPGEAGDGPVIDPGDDGDGYVVDIDPAAFTSIVDHPFLPKLPGTTWVYRATPSDGPEEIITVEVLDEYRTVMGVETIVVHDRVETTDGELIEDTYDWFAQDDDGNVWYFGEDTTAYEDGEASTEGAWEAGVDGALPGIVMPAEPTVSTTGYRQEYLAGEAEDMGQVIAVDGSASVPAGDYDDVVVTRDWTPLEPDVVEEKTYARGVGFVYETKSAVDGTTEDVVLVELAPGR